MTVDQSRSQIYEIKRFIAKITTSIDHNLVDQYKKNQESLERKDKASISARMVKQNLQDLKLGEVKDLSKIF
jgi:hypothetical protein